jgi:hypothetical protein
MVVDTGQMGVPLSARAREGRHENVRGPQSNNTQMSVSPILLLPYGSIHAGFIVSNAILQLRSVELALVYSVP